MAPRKPKKGSAWDTSAEPKQGSLLARLKSSIQNTKTKLSALRTSGAGKITKPATKEDMRIEREHLKQVVERLSIVKGSISPNSSTKEHVANERKYLKQVVERLSTAEGSTGSELSTMEQAKIEREHLKQVVERLSTIKGSTDFTSSSLHPTPATSPHIALQSPSTLTARDFEVGGTLGKGKFGLSSEERLIRREIEVHQNLSHPNIPKLLSWFHDAASIYLVLEYAPGGSLYTRLKKQATGRFGEGVAAKYVAQVASALRYMHAKNILHRDIKPENILLGLRGEIKLADFGYSVHSDSGFRSTVCGTLDYLSPEVAVMMLRPGKSSAFYTKAVDQWSLGVLMYELVVGRAPFEMRSGEATQKKIAGYRGEGIKFPAHVSEGAEGLFRQLLNLDAEERLGFEGVLAHPWVVGHTEKSRKSGVTSLGRMLGQAA